MKKYLFALFIGSLLLTSCKKWLDVRPESDVAEDDLFSTEAGFQESLNGIYIKCTDRELYGEELTLGLPEVLAQNFTISATERLRYQQTALYNYKDPFFITRKDEVWKRAYNAIVNCNVILTKIDAKKDVLSAENYALIKGEALALRAYLHFDLLRLFAPSFESNSSAPGIPYVTDFSNKVTAMSTVTEALQKIVADLEAAKALLVTHDPILTTAYQVGYPTDDEPLEQVSPSLFMHNRRQRMNYYAVCATLARAHLYMSNEESALENALVVINANKFPWTEDADFIAADPQQKDRIMYPELIFSWYVENLNEHIRNRFEAASVGLYIEPNSGNAIYETGGVGGEDLRFKEWFMLVNDISGNRLDILKYKRDNDVNRHYLVMPAIRLSEMYYIAAECTYDLDATAALNYVNTVRSHRGIGAPLVAADREQFIRELIKEARKETYAEGQLFYMYKRLNRNIVGHSGTTIPASNNIFVLPLPNDEIEFGDR